MLGTNKFNFWIDIVIFVAFMATAITGLMLWLLIPDGQGSGQFIFYGLTRRQWVDIHNWVGLAMLLGIIIHLVLHWRWINCVLDRFMGKLARQARINFSLDMALFSAFAVTGLSGLVPWLILPQGGFQGGRNPFYNATFYGLTRHQWNDIHLWVSLVMMSIIAVHLALHWRWIVCTTRRYTRTTLCKTNTECKAT
jgi:fucose 4-O-acetylase-like acetyltransferase